MTAITAWLERLAAAMDSPAQTDWDSLFQPDCYWRDFVALSWNIVTLEGVDAIRAMAIDQAETVCPKAFAADDPDLPMSDDTQGWFTFSTATARCRGHVRLVEGRARVVMTAITELIGHEEPGGARRPAGVVHRAAKGRKTWADERAEELARLGHDEQPYCLIVGGGHNGLQLAARLRRLGVPAIVVDALERPGDNWRVRYPSLYLHDPIYLDHFPYMPFPDHWPLFTHKDKMGDWLEIYARAMEINFWGSTTCRHASYDAGAGRWEVSLERRGEMIRLRPAHLVLATGLSGARHVPEIPGAASFAGPQYHAADHQGGVELAGKRCVVVGSNNSAHDIAADLWENDAQVTMIQRSPTIVVRADTMKTFSDTLPHANPDIPIDLADLMAASEPFRLRYAGETAMTHALRAIDANLYARLEAAGFQLSDGEDGTGFLMAYHRRAAGYYIDVGASDLIADGSIGLVHGEISRIDPQGVLMEDGTHLAADAIIYATGYRPMHEWVGRLISRDVEDAIGPCWGLGSDTEGDPGPWEGELRNMWKPTAQPGLWFQGGNLIQARFHSLHLALQLKARMEGLPVRVFQPLPN